MNNISSMGSGGGNAGLVRLGWDSFFQEHWLDLQDKSLTAARVVGVRRDSFLVSQGDGERLATASGRLRHGGAGLYPVTGDWVLLRESALIKVLPRKNALSRGASGARGKQCEAAQERQVIAANLDTVFVVCGLNRDFNLRRIERYLTLIYNCGVTPAIILTKADLHPEPASAVAQVESVAFGVPVHAVCALDLTGLESLQDYIAPGKTIALVGSSGAGKSTLVNSLAGQAMQQVGAISQSLHKGRHTTTTRDLIILPQGGLIIDNPGIREIALWDDGGGLENAFPEIEALAVDCRFADCTHTHEPGCRVLEGVLSGDIRHERLESYRKMRRELHYLAQRQDKSADRVEKEQWKGVAKKIKAMKKQKYME